MLTAFVDPLFMMTATPQSARGGANRDATTAQTRTAGPRVAGAAPPDASHWSSTPAKDSTPVGCGTYPWTRRESATGTWLWAMNRRATSSWRISSACR